MTAMDENQLLLLALATLIAGLATAPGIQALQQGLKQVSQEATASSALGTASGMQGHLQKPPCPGGASDVGEISANADLPTLSGRGYSPKSLSDRSPFPADLQKPKARGASYLGPPTYASSSAEY